MYVERNSFSLAIIIRRSSIIRSKRIVRKESTRTRTDMMKQFQGSRETIHPSVKVIKTTNKYDVGDGIMLVKRFVSHFFVLGTARRLPCRATNDSRQTTGRKRRRSSRQEAPPFRMIARFYVFIPVLCCNLLL